MLVALINIKFWIAALSAGIETSIEFGVIFFVTVIVLLSLILVCY